MYNEAFAVTSTYTPFVYDLETAGFKAYGDYIPSGFIDPDPSIFKKAYSLPEC